MIAGRIAKPFRISCGRFYRNHDIKCPGSRPDHLVDGVVEPEILPIRRDRSKRDKSFRSSGMGMQKAIVNCRYRIQSLILVQHGGCGDV